jgi:hypothetical protein
MSGSVLRGREQCSGIVLVHAVLSVITTVLQISQYLRVLQNYLVRAQNFHLSEFWKPLQFLRESPVRFVLRNRRQ